MTPQDIATPCFAIDVEALETNARLLADVKQRSGCRILLATKAYAMWRTFPMLRHYLDGTCASSPYEARLGREEFMGEVEAFSAAYSDLDIKELVQTCDTIIFNSFSQWHRYRDRVAGTARPIRCGLRINPEVSTQTVPLYDPCAPGSHLGICRHEFEGQSLEGISGLHFHSLCEQGAEDLATTWNAVVESFGDLLQGMSWVNMGGGHHITKAGYDVDLLCKLISDAQLRYGLTVYLEPGEAVALDAGVLLTSVLDVRPGIPEVAILDISATAHMPDVLEMPYRPHVYRCGTSLRCENAVEGRDAGSGAYTYRLAGPSCLAGDVIGLYAFDEPLRPGNRLFFGDMAIYSMVKTTMFNGLRHPAIALYHARSNALDISREFCYEDFRNRLA
ncbi:MAG: carboxynorspermidine decarboxylase [Kiritimatiellae bacterium]|nr:carboxynorspermidine decarboxylase [Kiritimatiellia bacterium]